MDDEVIAICACEFQLFGSALNHLLSQESRHHQFSCRAAVRCVRLYIQLYFVSFTLRAILRIERESLVKLIIMQLTDGCKILKSTNLRPQKLISSALLKA